MSVKRMLCASMIIWAALAIWSHGITIVIYLTIQLATTGLFVFAFQKAEKKYGKTG